MSSTALRINDKSYGKLLVRTLPRVIHSEDEYDHFISELMRLEEVEDLTPEQEGLAELLTVLVEKYEERRYPIRQASPQQVLRHLMEARNLIQKDMLKIFGSKGITSEVLNGKRSISKAHAKKLAKFFHVSAELFI